MTERAVLIEKVTLREEILSKQEGSINDIHKHIAGLIEDIDELVDELLGVIQHAEKTLNEVSQALANKDS